MTVNYMQLSEFKRMQNYSMVKYRFPLRLASVVTSTSLLRVSLFFPFLASCTVNLLHCNVTFWTCADACLLWGRYVVVHALGAWWCVVVLGACGGCGDTIVCRMQGPAPQCRAWCMIHGYMVLWWVGGCGGLGVCGGHGKKQGGLSSQVLRAVI